MITHVAIHAELFKKISLENAVLRPHSQVCFQNERPENRYRDVGMIPGR